MSCAKRGFLVPASCTVSTAKDVIARAAVERPPVKYVATTRPMQHTVVSAVASGEGGRMPFEMPCPAATPRSDGGACQPPMAGRGFRGAYLNPEQ